jgi:hypothetical protein
MIITELKSEDEIYRTLMNCWHDYDDSKLPPLFHGTDASLVGLSKAERLQLNTDCELIIKTLYSLYKANSIKITDKRLIASRDSYGHSATAFVFAEARANKSPLYSYGEFYVTNNPSRAMGYSTEAWIYGETGWIANRLIEGAKAINLQLPDNDEFKTAVQTIDARKQKPKHPVILMVLNGCSTGLYRESGENYTSEEIQIIKSEVYTTRSFRLRILPPERDSLAFMICKENYGELLHAWEKASDERNN